MLGADMPGVPDGGELDGALAGAGEIVGNAREAINLAKELAGAAPAPLLTPLVLLVVHVVLRVLLLLLLLLLSALRTSSSSPSSSCLSSSSFCPPSCSSSCSCSHSRSCFYQDARARFQASRSSAATTRAALGNLRSCRRWWF